MFNQDFIDDLYSDPKKSLLEKFWVYHADNPAIYEQICRFTQEAIDSGRSFLGISMIFERIRWYTTVEARGEFAEGFKLNNNYRAFYARMWLVEHPGHPNFFRIRQQRHESIEVPTHIHLNSR